MNKFTALNTKEESARVVRPKIQYELTSGGSGRGMSFYQSYAQCPRRVNLDRKYRSEMPETISGSTGIGTIFHALQDIYHSKKYNGKDNDWSIGDVEFTGLPIETSALAEGWRIFSHYRDRYKPDAFGTVMFSERRFPSDNREAFLMAAAAFGETEFAIDSTFSNPAITAQFDLTTLATDETLEYWEQEFGVRGQKPGWYIVDWKTDSNERATLVDEYRYRLQFAWYQMAFNALFPATKLRGIIAAVLVKKKMPVFRPIFLPAVTAAETTAVKSFLLRQLEQAQRDPNEARPTNCFSWFRMCPHLELGRCERY